MTAALKGNNDGTGAIQVGGSGSAKQNNTLTVSGGSGAPGIVIIEEFY